MTTTSTKIQDELAHIDEQVDQLKGYAHASDRVQLLERAVELAERLQDTRRTPDTLINSGDFK